MHRLRRFFGGRPEPPPTSESPETCILVPPDSITSNYEYLLPDLLFPLKELKTQPKEEEESGLLQLYPEVLLHIISFLSPSEVANLSQTCHHLRTVIEGHGGSSLWRHFFQRRLQLHCNHAHLSEEFVQTIEKTSSLSMKSHFRLSTLRIGANSMTIVHCPSPNYWQIQTNRSDSIFGTVAHLTTVCWLQIDATLRGVPKGTYNVLWRLNFLQNRATDFRSAWKVTANGQDVLLRNTEPHWIGFQSMVQKGWVTYNLGSILVLEDETNLSFQSLGGNNYWFGDWEVDWIQLIPIDQRHFNKLSENVALDPGIGLETPVPVTLLRTTDETAVSEKEKEKEEKKQNRGYGYDSDL